MRLLILGTGGMAAQHAKHFAAIDGVTVVGGVDVDPNRLEKFNQTHNIPNGFASFDAAVAWGEFDAVANVTPDSIHHATSIAALLERPPPTGTSDSITALKPLGRKFCVAHPAITPVT